MILLPAIDIRGGRAVRLRQGDFAQETVYAASPLEAARAWVEAGAEGLHVVDLDGAKAGRPASLGHLEAIAAELAVPVQYGGGLRSLEAVDGAVGAGAARVVLGTVALRDPDLVREAVRRHGERVSVGIDVREGAVSVAGWTEATSVPPAAAIERMQEVGVTRFVYTSVDRDGMLEGIDPEEVRAVGAVVAGSFIYSGGIGSLADLEAVSELGLDNLEGVISGKALYERRFSVADARAALAAA